MLIRFSCAAHFHAWVGSRFAFFHSVFSCLPNAAICFLSAWPSMSHSRSHSRTLPLLSRSFAFSSPCFFHSIVFSISLLFPRPLSQFHSFALSVPLPFPASCLFHSLAFSLAFNFLHEPVGQSYLKQSCLPAGGSCLARAGFAAPGAAFPVPEALPGFLDAARGRATGCAVPRASRILLAVIL